MNHYWILTAAHCVKESNDRIHVLLGEHDISVKEGVEQAFNGVLEVHVHEYYGQMFSSHNDIALIRLKSPIEFTDDVQPVCPPQPTESYIGKTAVVSGWGRNSTSKSICVRGNINIVSPLSVILVFKNIVLE